MVSSSRRALAEVVEGKVGCGLLDVKDRFVKASSLLHELLLPPASGAEAGARASESTRRWRPGSGPGRDPTTPPGSTPRRKWGRDWDGLGSETKNRELGPSLGGCRRGPQPESRV